MHVGERGARVGGDTAGRREFLCVDKGRAACGEKGHEIRGGT